MKVASIMLTGMAVALSIGAPMARAVVTESSDDAVGRAVAAYFDNRFKDLQGVARQAPTVENFRTLMKPIVDRTEGVFGATLIDTNFVIDEVYFKRDALARGFDLKKVKQLDGFWAMMREQPAPQLSEPGHGNLFQPRLIAMRYPYLKDGKLQGIVSLMIRTDYFLKAAGLDRCQAFQIVVQGEVAEEKGALSANARTVHLSLPSTEWVIKYQE